MDEIAKSLGPAFVAGFAVQRTLEILDPLSELLGKAKKIVLSLISLGMGLGIAYGAQLEAIHAFAPKVSMSDGMDMFITGLVISGGTEGLNSLMKFLNYKKEQTKADAVSKRPDDPDGEKAFRAAASRI